MDRISEAAPTESYTVAIPMPAPASAHTVIDVDVDIVRQELMDRLKETATHLTDENAEMLLAMLGEFGVMSRADIDELIGTARTRDQLRAVGSGVIVFLSSFALGGAVNTALASVSTTLAGKMLAPLAGNITSAVLNPTVAQAAEAGRLRPRYQPLPPPGPGPVSFSGKKGDAHITDMPFRNFVGTYMLADAISAQAELTHWPHYLMRTVAGMAATAWAARDIRAGVEAKAAARGEPVRQSWLDASDIRQTRAKLHALRRPAREALAGYAQDVLNSARHLPHALLTTAASPRLPASLAALAPTTLFSMLREALPDQQILLKALADFTMVTPGWENRRVLEHYISGGRPEFSHASAAQSATERMDRLTQTVKTLAGFLPARSAPADIEPGSPDPSPTESDAPWAPLLRLEHELRNSTLNGTATRR
ncbi:hypothetical protein [Trinickia mobilis]|uniref:hypothetical protein n=1 Tax=Trinickia mobilis TaxID=2816356 RepID=UPI001A8C8604|nr:hypothetical protein [Trinickia mobilis]